MPRPLLTATRDELIERVRMIFNPIQSFTMKVDMSPSIGSLYGGQVTDYPTIGGYVIFQQPDRIRVIGLDPVIHSTGFDMVSTGNEYHVSIPIKSLFVKGHNDAPPAAGNKLENLRPKAFLDALLIRPPDAEADISFIEDDTNETKAVYILTILGHEGKRYYPIRNIYFDRYTLQVNRQKTFDQSGNILGETRYSDWNDYGGFRFPSTIDLQRPKEGYEVVLKVTSLKINGGEVGPDKFVLEQPAGYHLRQLP